MQELKENYLPPLRLSTQQLLDESEDHGRVMYVAHLFLHQPAMQPPHVVALRAEVEQIKARQTAAPVPRAAAPAQPRASGKAAAKPEPPPLPFRVVGAELRAGQRSVSVAPSSADFTPDQLQVLLPGDALGPWHLQAIEGNTAVFQAGNQTRRVAIP